MKYSFPYFTVTLIQQTLFCSLQLELTGKPYKTLRIAQRCQITLLCPHRAQNLSQQKHTLYLLKAFLGNTATSPSKWWWTEEKMDPANWSNAWWPLNLIPTWHTWKWMYRVNVQTWKRVETCQEINSGIKSSFKADLAINILAINIPINQLLPGHDKESCGQLAISFC